MNGPIFYTILFALNILTFGLFGLDKHKAVYNRWRISETLLLTLSILGGAYGALMGMWLFRHKTKHTSFNITVPVCFIIWMLVLIIICLLNSPVES